MYGLIPRYAKQDHPRLQKNTLFRKGIGIIKLKNVEPISRFPLRQHLQSKRLCSLPWKHRFMYTNEK